MNYETERKMQDWVYSQRFFNMTAYIDPYIADLSMANNPIDEDEYLEALRRYAVHNLPEADLLALYIAECNETLKDSILAHYDPEGTGDEPDEAQWAAAWKAVPPSQVEEPYPETPEDIASIAEEIISTGCEIPEQYIEVYEWYFVPRHIARFLAEAGEIVLNDELWGRCCTGQSIILDSVIQDAFEHFTKHTNG
jgi:hypothetical protein